MEILEILKHTIEKFNFKTLLVSVAISITSNLLWINNWIWSIVVFCCTYLLIYAITLVFEYLHKKYKRHTFRLEQNIRNERERTARYNKLSIIFKGFDTQTQQILIDLYGLPMQEYSNIKILSRNEHINILHKCDIINSTLNYYKLFEIEYVENSAIITIDPVFNQVLKENTIKIDKSNQ